MPSLNNFQNQPPEKPLVKRVHGTITTQLFELLPGSSGHNIKQDSKSISELIAEDPDLEPHVDAWIQYSFHLRLQNYG